MEGYLKQKMQGLDGILCWRQRHFVLDPRKRCLTVTDDVDDIVNGARVVSTLYPISDTGAKLSVTRVLLEGARRAVAWSGIDAFNGCGFNIVWATGRVWSILCDDPDSRKSWVDALNHSIRDVERDTGGDLSAEGPFFKGSGERKVKPDEDRRTRKGRVRGCSKGPGNLWSLHERPTPPLPPRSEEAARAATRQRSVPLESTSPSVGENGLSCFRNERGKRLTRSELSSSGYWIGENRPLDCATNETEIVWQRRCRCRYQELGLRAAIPGEDSVCPGAVCALSEVRYHGGKHGVADNTTEAREFDDVKGFVNGVGRGICWRRESGDGGGGRGDKSRACEKSEQLAKASAATWGQFQRLLERSRESKARYDRAIDAAAESGTGAVEGRRTVASDPEYVNKSLQAGLSNTRYGISAAKQRTESRTVSPARSESQTTTTSSSVRPLVDSSSPNGSSTDRFTVSAAASCVGGYESENGNPDIPAVKTAAVWPAAGIIPNGCANSKVDPVGQSRLSRVTEVETNFLEPRREAEGDDRSSTDGSIGDKCNRTVGAKGHRQRRRKKLQQRVSSPKLARQHRKLSVAPEKTKDILVSRLRLLEAELERERREAAAAARAETRLRHELTKSDAERRRLEGEVATTKSADERERQEEIESAITRALAEREKRCAETEVQRREGVRFKAALAAAEKAEKKREEVMRQKGELEKALAAEISERRRVSSLLKESSRSETSLRERLVATEGDGDLKARLASTRAELDAVRRERDSLTEELDRCIARLGDQAKEVALALRSKQQREVADISSRCEMEKEEMREQLVQEAEERVRKDTRTVLAMQEKRLRTEAAEAAQREAKLSEKKLREVRAEADAAGEATHKDIEKLRRLHAKRVRQLEALLKEETDNLADARREIAVCKTTQAGDAGEFQRWTEEQRDQSGRLFEELARIQKRVDKAVAKEAAAQEREGLAMGRLRNVMEEARLERAEGIELRRQLREALAELESNHNAQARRARSDIQLQRAAEIAQQEVAMLEAERSRWNEERRSMETALDRLKRLVYGASTTSKATTTSSKSKICINPAASVKNASGCSWRPNGGAMSEGGWGRAFNSSRSACSSTIGLKVAQGSK